MASLQQGEKQLFEKFWEGTFKAVATPRLGSIIMASITSRNKPLASTNAPSYLPVPREVIPSKEPNSAQKTLNGGCGRQKGNQENVTRKSHSLSWDAESTPPPTKEKKKKKKSSRKKRRRSPSYSPSPLKKKKKKKKNSKKRKRNRISSKKKRHSFLSPKRKRKTERKHKKHSHGRPQRSQRCHHHHHHHHRSSSDSTNSLLERCRSRLRSRLQKEGHQDRHAHIRHSSKTARKAANAAEMAGSPFLGCSLQNNCFLSTSELISHTGSAADLFEKAAGQLGKQVKQNRDLHEYDSGNATSSPPSIQTSTSRSKDSQGKPEEPRCQAHDGFSRAFSSGKACGGSSSDSGNSFSSCSSQSKEPAMEEPRPSLQGLGRDQKEEPRSSLRPPGKKKESLVSPALSGSPLLPSLRNESSSRTSSLASCRSHLLRRKVGRRPSPSRSCCSSETRWSSRSPSYCRRGSGSSSSRSQRSPSYSRSRPDRSRKQDHNYGSSRKESHRRQDRWRRKQSYSPMRKRRRDSPSHLEARRITSARKRPIPYHRPSPSSSSHSSASIDSPWYRCPSSSPSWAERSCSARTSRSRSRSWGSHDGSQRSTGTGSRQQSSSHSSDWAGSYDSPRH